MIEVENLVKRYGNHMAVDHLSFKVDDGQVYGFLGPNGAGKSTTMNMMTGYLAATEGTVKINGFDILTQPEEAKKCIGYLPEIPPLYVDMTVGEYLKFVAELKKVPKAERTEQVAEVMDATQITDMKNRLIKNLSKGYRQRVGLAQAMIGKPDVIILDEPTVGLDPKQIIEIRELIAGLKKDHTVILSSHILSEVSAICDQIMIISKGKLVACDTPEGLQNMMSATAELEISVMGDADIFKGVVDAFEGVQEFRFEDAHEDGCVKALIITDSKVDIRKDLAVKLNELNMPVMSMNRVEKSLEDIFLTLTSDSTSLHDIQQMQEQNDIQQTQDQKEEKQDDSNI
ncbi:MAG: ABC transporter ATP-binding protein [Lachnospiraceae bacterium]|nr:ABC transporter ATP-binding protein [Lachnospiraceae bacterium]